MSISISQKPEQNVVNVGDELSQNALNAIQAAVSPSSSNRLITDSELTSSVGTKLTNTINWLGDYNNGVTYQAGDGVRHNNEYYVLKAYIGAAGYDPTGYANSWTKVIPSLSGYQLTSGMSAYQTVSGMSLYALKASSNTFSAPQQFDVSSSSSAALRVNAGTTTSVSNAVGAFYVSVLNASTLGHAVVIENRGGGDCIRIHDQTADDPTKFVVDASGNVTLGGDLTLVSTALNQNVGAQTYPHELTFKVGSTTYRVPARAI